MGTSRAVILVLVAACAPEDVTPSSEGGGENFENPYPVNRVRLEQTENSEIAPSLSLACSDETGTKENSWYRIFNLADFGVDRTFVVHRVNFGVQTAVGSQRVKVSLGTYAGSAGAVELDTSKIDMLALSTVSVPEGKAYVAQANFAGAEIPAGANLVVEVKTEGIVDGGYFYLGATNANEMVPGYLRAPTCKTLNPVMTSALGYLGTHLVISVSGSY